MSGKALSYLIQEPPMQYLNTLGKCLGVPEALILQQINYWCNENRSRDERAKRKDHFFEGRWWCYNSLSAWQAEFDSLSPSMVRRAFQKLRDLGIMVTGNFNPHKRTIWYAIDYSMYEAFIGFWEQSGCPAAYDKRYSKFIQNWLEMDTLERGSYAHHEQMHMLTMSRSTYTDKTTDNVKPVDADAINPAPTKKQENERRYGIACAYGQYRTGQVPQGQAVGVYKKSTKPLADMIPDLTGDELSAMFAWYAKTYPDRSEKLAKAQTIAEQVIVYRATLPSNVVALEIPTTWAHELFMAITPQADRAKVITNPHDKVIEALLKAYRQGRGLEQLMASPDFMAVLQDEKRGAA